MAAVNGGVSRRRQRSSSLRDSPEEDGGMELAETTRLRDRGSKKDRDRDRSSRSKRRRGERMLHGNNRDEGDDSSEESVDEEEEDEEDDVSVAVRLPPPAPPPPNPASSFSSLPQSNHHHNHQQQNRKSFPTKVSTRTPPVWKPDEMIGFSVPRKARSASTKRSHECWVSGGSGSGEQVPRQAPASPSRLSPASTTQISPSSNATARKKMKPMSGPKHRPPKVSKSPSLIEEDIEIEVAEVLFGMTRQFQCPPKQENSKIDSKEMNGSAGNESKSRVSSPNAISPPPPVSQTSVLPPSNSTSNPSSLSAIAPKRKRPRPVKFEDESPTSPVGLDAPPSTSVSSSAKLESEQPGKTEASSPRSEKNTASPAIENGGGSIDVSVPQVAATALDVQQESAKTENNSVPDAKLLKGELNGQNRTESRKEAASPAKETSCADLDVNHVEETAAKRSPTADSVREEKFNIDLMVPPPERDELCDFDAYLKSQVPEIDMVSKISREKKEEGKAVERTTQTDEIPADDRKVEKSTKEESNSNSKKQMGKERTFDLQLDLEKPDKDSLDGGRLPFQKQQPKVPKSEPEPERTASSASVPMPMAVAGWPGSFPSFGYMGQVPSLQAAVPMDGTPGSSSILQPPSFLSPQPRPKRCATHCYIAQNISYHLRLAKINPFWPAAAGSTPPIYGVKPYNLNAVPPADAFAGGFPGRNASSFQDNKRAAASVSALSVPPSKEMMPSAKHSTAEAPQRKQQGHQQPPQPGSAANSLPGPAFVFPLNQQQAAAAAVAAAATRSGVSKSTPGPPSSGASSSAVMGSATGGPAAPMSLSFASLPPNETQYLAILQNNAYPFPIPAHVAGAPPYRGASPGQAMPFFYPSQVLHPSQLQQQGLQQPPHAQQGRQNTSTSSGSSSSQKHLQQPQQALGGGASGGGNSLGFPATNQRQHLLPHQARQQESDKGLEDSPSTADSRVSQAQKSIYSHSFAMPIYSQNFALMSNASTAGALGTVGGHSDKQSLHHHQQQPLQNQTSSQAFPMPFAFSGAGAAPPGLDFPSMAQKHALFQSFPEQARHGYHHFATAADQAAQQKKAMEDGKPAADLMNASAAPEEERKMMAGSKAPASGSQHCLNFSKPDSEPPISSIIGNSVIESSSRTLNLIPAASNAGRTANRSGGAAPLTTLAATASVNLSNSQQQQQLQQQLFLLQRQQQLQNLHQQQQQRHLASTHVKSSTSSNGASVYSDRLPGGSTKYPQTLPNFPQSLIQGGSPTQSPQWKASAARSGTPAPAPAPSPAQSVVKNNHLLQQQPSSRASQQHLPAAGHQTQVSFGVNSMKTVSTGGQHHSGATGNPSPSPSATPMAVGSPSNSLSKTAGGSPRASASAKPGQPATAVPLPPQSSAKSSASSSSCKSSPARNQNVPSILGHPHITSAPSSGSKPHQTQQQPQQFARPHPFPNAPLMFSNVYPLLQARSPQANAAAAAAAAAGYYQRHPSEQQLPQQSQQQHQHQPNASAASTGMLALGGPSALMMAGASTTNDPAKAGGAAAASNMKGFSPPGVMHAAQLAAAAQSAAGAPHHIIPGSFPYMMPPVPVKPAADQKPAAA
ncbi:protein TIME FOR COFFEE-like [Phoenix dactylifera]|uniref:Protein TIME FOR COFFEE-like n=1 Tax=Phoenix dactylifera TaxID=42345 RepID=A0A8B7CMZ4_PHODC|nr:protein TIME FOR COFFEE-like [Phoenix dactylifera]